MLVVIQVQYYRRVDQSLNTVDKDHQRSSAASQVDSLLDATSGWISSSSDLVRLFEALSSAADSPSTAVTPLLAASSVHAMLNRPSYDRPTAGTVVDARSKVWYGLGLVVQDDGRTFWHSGTLDGSTSVVARDGDVGLTWAALVNCPLEPHNDLWDLMRYAVRRVFAVPPSITPPLPTSFNVSSPSPSAAAAADPPWPQQHDSSVTRHNEVVRPKPSSLSETRSTVRQLVDSVSSDGRTAVKLMIPSYGVSDVMSTVAAAGYRPTWLDAVVYYGRVFFNVIWTHNDKQLRSKHQ